MSAGILPLQLLGSGYEKAPVIKASSVRYNVLSVEAGHAEVYRRGGRHGEQFNRGSI